METFAYRYQAGTIIRIRAMCQCCGFRNTRGERATEFMKSSSSEVIDHHNFPLSPRPSHSYSRECCLVQRQPWNATRPGSKMEPGTASHGTQTKKRWARETLEACIIITFRLFLSRSRALMTSLFCPRRKVARRLQLAICSHAHPQIASPSVPPRFSSGSSPGCVPWICAWWPRAIGS